MNRWWASGVRSSSFEGITERERERTRRANERTNERTNAMGENKRWSLWAKGPVVVFPSEVEEEDERDRWSTEERIKKGMQNRFVGNSFLLFEPVFSLYAAFLFSSSFSLPPIFRRPWLLSCFRCVRANKHSEARFLGLDLVIDRQEELRADSYDLSNGDPSRVISLL